MRIPANATWVRFPRFVGDAAMQLSVLRLLRLHGIGPLVVWGPAATVSLVEDHELADAVVPETAKPGPWSLARTLREHRAARSIHFPKSLRPALAAFMAGVPERLGVSESGAGLFNTHTAPFWKAPGTFLERYHGVLRLRWPDLPPMPYPDYDPGVQVALPDVPYICLMPGSVWDSKRWPAGHFRELARIAKGKGIRTVVLGASSEAEACREVAGAEGLDLSGRTTLKEAAAWLRGALAAVGNDSGLCHLAGACGTPVVAIYGPTLAAVSVVWGPRARTIQAAGPACVPCYERTCRMAGHPCLAGVGPEQVWEALQGLVPA